MNASITFIIPAFNAARTLADTLGSLTAQTRGDWRAIVIDDGSTDGTFTSGSLHLSPRSKNLDSLLADPRIETIHQANSGVAASRNRGLSLSSTPAVCFLDADDTVEPGFIDRMLPALKGHDLVAAAYRYAGPQLEDVGWTVVPAASDVQGLTEFNQFAIGAIVFDRSSLVRLAGDRPFPSGSRQEDWELLVSLRGAKWGMPITEPLYSYRLTPESRTTALCEVWRDGMNLIARHAPEPTPAIRRWTLRNLARAAAAGDRRLCTRMFEHLDTLSPADTQVLAGALRWSMRRMTVAGEVHPAPDAWHASMLRLLGSSDVAAEALGRAGHPDWNQIAQAAAARVGPDQTLVIYGLGRNGRDLLKALEPKRLALAVIDDGPATTPGLPRLTIPDLGPKHIVLVTPDDRAAILKGLGQGRQAQILLPEHLVA